MNNVIEKYKLWACGVKPFLRNGDLVKGRQGEMTASQVKKLYFDELPSVLRDLRQYRHLDTERIVYRLYFGEGMVALAGYPG